MLARCFYFEVTDSERSHSDSHALRNALLPDLSDHDKDWIAQKAATTRQVTIAQPLEFSHEHRVLSISGI